MSGLIRYVRIFRWSSWKWSSIFAGMQNRIREHRRARGWTIDDLADVVGTSKSHISNIETGKRDASVSMLQAIAQALGVSSVDLFATRGESDDLLVNLTQDFARLSPEDQRAVARHARALVPKGSE